MYHPPTNPGQFVNSPPQPPKKVHPWRWYRSRGCILQSIIGCATLFVLVFVGFICSAVSIGIFGSVTESALTPVAVATNVPQYPTKVSISTPRPTSIAKLTTAQKSRVGAILNENIQHYQSLLTQGKSILGTT